MNAPGEFNPCHLIYVLDLTQAEKSLASGTRWWTEPAERKDVPTLKKISKRSISGFILNNYWLGIGPFDNTDNKGLTVPYPPEREFDASATYQGKTREVRWQRLRDSRIDGLLMLYGIIDEWVEGPDGLVSEFSEWNEELNQWIWEPDECHSWGLIVRITDDNGRPIETLQYAIPR